MKTNWQTKKLGEVCDIFNGLWKGKKPPYVEVNVIRNTNFTKDGFLNDSDIANLPVEIKQYENRKLKFGDLILEKSGGGPKQPVGRIIIFNKKNGEYSFSNFTSAVRIRNNKELDFNFLHRFLYFQYISGITETMQRRSTGIRNLQLKEYKQIQIPLPPLPEQKRIVKILDETFEKLEKVKQNTEQNLKNSQEIFDSYLKDVFEKGGEDWEVKKLKEVCEKITDGTHQTPKYFDSGYIFLSSRNVKSKKINWENIKYIDSKQHFEMQRRVSPQKGDILLAKNGTTGVAAMVDKDVEFDIYVSLAHLRSLGKVSPEFLLYFINSFAAKKQFNKRLKGSGVPNLHLEEIREVVINFPKSIKEQKKIVEKLDKLSEQAKKLEKIYQRKIDNIKELKKSILQKAFEREL